MLSRRMLLTAAAALFATPAGAAEETFASLEKASGGRLGIAAHDTGSDKRIGWRETERFPMCSTFKFLLAAAVLKRIDSGSEQRDRLVTFATDDLVTWSPVTERQAGAGHGLSIGALIDAILLYSDNTAANLLLKTIGGPPGWTEFARSLGDEDSRLDRIEIALNSAVPGDLRDTTTPAAMLKNLKTVLLGDVLSETSRRRLIDIMAGSTIGAHRLKMGLPAGWRIADKTGTGPNGTVNDIAILFPPGRAPVLACAYLTGATAPGREQILAGAGGLIAKI